MQTRQFLLTLRKKAINNGCLFNIAQTDRQKGHVLVEHFNTVTMQCIGVRWFTSSKLPIIPSWLKIR
jgi:hypothetical protein